MKSPTSSGGQSPLSLTRLRDAFAEMLGSHSPRPLPPDAAARAAGDSSEAECKNNTALSEVDPCELSPRTLVEAMLFVGHPDNRPFSARELAAAMRGVSPAEIDAAVAELTAMYAEEAAPFQIVTSAAGYRLALHNEFGRMRDKFHGRAREARLSPAAVEVLSIVAYHQPVTAEQIGQLRGAPSGGALTTLVRRKLVRLERPGTPGDKPRFSTTDRFLRLFGLDSAAALPRSEELDKA